MNKILIVDASESDRRLMSGLLIKHGYEYIHTIRFSTVMGSETVLFYTLIQYCFTPLFSTE